MLADGDHPGDAPLRDCKSDAADVDANDTARNSTAGGLPGLVRFPDDIGNCLPDYNT
jgi:hypothetical protein